MKQRDYVISDEVIPDSLQETLNQLADRMADRKDEVVDALSDEQPRKSRMVEDQYTQCTWWEGCYYCRDENQVWHRVKCFI